MKVERGQQHCPKCANKLLHVETGGETVEVCVGCRGLWFDAGELTVMLGVYQRLDTVRAGRAGVFCIRCGGNVELKELPFPGTDVDVDVCPDCRGIWLDDGELQLLQAHVDAVILPEDPNDAIDLASRARALLSDAERAGEQRFSCPKCAEKLWHLGREGNVIEVCSGCEGMWFDGGELTVILGVYRRIETGEGKPTEVACVRCSAKLVELPYPGTDVDVDVCPDCRGVWLDRGELTTLKADLSRFVPPDQGTLTERAAVLLDDLDRGAMTRAACPRCGGKLEILREGGYPREQCAACGGTWLDSGDLTRAVGVSRRIRLPDEGPVHLDIRCVRCPNQVLVELPYPGTDVSIDVCPDCRGVWLDPGELDRLRTAVGAD